MPFQSPKKVRVPPCSLPTLLFKSPSHPLESSKPCFLDADCPEKHFLTLASFRLWCQRFALGLQRFQKGRAGTSKEASGRNRGFNPGDRVLLLSENSLYYPVIFLGVAMAGGIFTGANPSLVERELVHQLKDSGAKYLVSSRQGLEVALKAATKVGIDGDHVFLFDDSLSRSSSTGSQLAKLSVSHRHWSELLAGLEESKSFQWPLLDSPTLAKTTLILNYSSGTTGMPKGVETSHANYVAVLVQGTQQATTNPAIAAAMARTRMLIVLPMYHVSSQITAIGIAPLLGISAYIMKKFSLPHLLSSVQQQKITTMILSPPIVVSMIKSSTVKNYGLSSLSGAISAGAPISETTMKAFDRLWPPGKMAIKSGWGMTELVGTVTGHNAMIRAPPLSIGQLLPNCEAKIIDPSPPHQEINGRGPRATGELLVRGPNVMKGYWHNPTATREIITPDGWLRTGDIAYVDDQDNLFIVDRRKELIKARANQISPSELEGVLLEHPAVADAAVVGVVTRASRPGGAEPGDEEERPKAYVVLQPGEKAQQTTEKDLLQYVEKNVAPYKRITGGLVLVRAIPKTESGKTKRAELREWAILGDRAARDRGRK